jgi:hypothetical protein
VEDSPALAALDAWAAGSSLPDEATAIDGPRVDVESLLAAFARRPPPGDRTRLWLDHKREVGQSLADALSRPGPSRQRALESLDSRADGPGLVPLAPGGSAPLALGVAAAVREVAGGQQDRLAGLMSDVDPETQGLAMRILVKLGDPRVTPARIAAAAASKSQTLRETAAFVAARKTRTSPAAPAAIAEALAPLLAEASPWEVRLSAVAALGALGEPGARPLERALGDDSPLVRAAAAQALAGTEAATPALVTAADDPVSAVRAAVARALSGRRSPAARAALDRLARDESARVRGAAGVTTAASEAGSRAREMPSHP